METETGEKEGCPCPGTCQIQVLSGQLKIPVGYSDHTEGVDAAPIAVSLGACIIEKHFTLDKHFSEFRDHQISADPREMRELVQRIRKTSLMLGMAEKTIQPSEVSAVQAIRRSIVAGADLPQGHRLAWPDLTWIRPAGGLAPGEEGVLVGKVLRRNVQFGEPLGVSDVE